MILTQTVCLFIVFKSYFELECMHTDLMSYTIPNKWYNNNNDNNNSLIYIKCRQTTARIASLSNTLTGFK